MRTEVLTKLKKDNYAVSSSVESLGTNKMHCIARKMNREIAIQAEVVGENYRINVLGDETESKKKEIYDFIEKAIRSQIMGNK